MFNPSQGQLHAAMQQQRFLQQQSHQQQIAAATQLAASVNQPTSLMADAQVNQVGTPSLDNFGNTGGMSFALDAANAAKQMAALQAAGRSRAQSNSTPGSQAGFPTALNSASGMAGGNPLGNTPSSSMDMQAQQQQQQQQHRMQLQHAQNLVFSQLLTNRPANFLPMLAEVMAQRNTPLPPAMTGVPSNNYDPSSSRINGISPGSVVGTFKLCGTDIDLHNLLIWIMQRGGSQKNQFDEGAWATFLAHVGLPRHQPSASPTQPPIDMVGVLRQHFAILLAPFEQHWAKQIQQRIVHVLRQQQQMQQAIAANGGQPLNAQQMGTVQAMANANVPGFGGLGMPQMPPQQAPQAGLTFPQQPQQMLNAGQMSLQQQPFQAPNAAGGLAQMSTINGIQQPNAPFSSSPDHTTQRQMSVSSDAMMPPFNPSTENAASLVNVNLTEETHADTSLSDADSVGKRKRSDTAELEGKRPRLDDHGMDGAAHIEPVQHDPNSFNGMLNSQHFSPTRPSAVQSAPPPSNLPQPRPKIQYRPLFRTLNSYGGRNLAALERDRAGILSKRSVRPIEEWGEIDIEGVIMALRSRVNVEITYAISALLAVSIAGKQEQAAFPLQPCEDLVPVLVDLLKDIALPGIPEELPARPEHKSPSKVYSHHDLLKMALDDSSELFATGLGWGPRQSRRDWRRTADDTRGPTDRPAEVVLMILQLFRNLSIFPNNAETLSNHSAVTDLLLRISLLDESTLSGGHPEPLSPVFTLADLAKAQDHVVHFLANTSAAVKLENFLPQTPTRIFRLLSSYLTSPHAAVSPFHAAQIPQSGPDRTQPPQLPLPPTGSDLALDAFSRIAQRDSHRKLFSLEIPQAEVYTMFNCLTQMLPVSREDFTVMTLNNASLEPWVGYAERVVLSLYSLVFLSPPALKRRMRQPGIISIIRRLAYFYMKCLTPEGKPFAPQNQASNNYPFMVISRRAIEILKLLDDTSDPFADEALEGGGTLDFPTFGIGYGEPDAMGTKTREEGMGLLVGCWEDVVTRMMLCPGVDDEFFIEMDNLIRVTGTSMETVRVV